MNSDIFLYATVGIALFCLLIFLMIGGVGEDNLFAFSVAAGLFTVSELGLILVYLFLKGYTYVIVACAAVIVVLLLFATIARNKIKKRRR